MLFQTQKVIQKDVLHEAQNDTNTVVDFEIVAENSAYVGSVLSISSVTLRNVRYSDGSIQDVISSGFCFIDSKGKMSDFYEITKMDEQITILYEGCMKSYSVTGIIPENLKIIADYTDGSVYAGEKINVDAIRLKVYPGIEGMSGYEVEGSTATINLDDYSIQVGNNTISGAYTFYETEQEIPFTVTVTGKENPVKAIKATYKGSSKVGTQVTSKDFQIEMTLESGKKIKSELDPSIYDQVILSGDTLLSNGVNIVHIVYKDGKISTDCKINLSGVPIVVKTADPATQAPTTNTPSQPPKTSEPTPSVTLVPVTSEPSQKDFENSPMPAITPMLTNTPMVTTTPDLPVQQITTPIVSIVPSETPIVSVRVGETYTISGICYKVSSYGKSEKEKTVTITGYKKTAKKIDLKNTISIKEQKFRVVCIGNRAFKNCKKLKGVLVIPAYVTKIGDYTFMGCSNIDHVELAKSVRRIGKKSFYNCKKIEDFWIKGKTIDFVGKDALKKQKQGRSIAFPPGRKMYYLRKLRGKH